MGYVNLPQSARSVLKDIARLSYGFGLFEGRNGGKGRMGLVTAPGSGPRVIKFNTHYHDRGPLGARQSPEMLESSNQLRELLGNLARSANLPEETLRDIRHRLELDRDKPPKSLLDRKVVAKVVQSIGGNEVWEEIEGEKNLERFRTKNVATSFADMKGRVPPSHAASIQVNELKSLDSFAGKDGAFGKIVGQELDELEAFCASHMWDEEQLRDLRTICKSLLDEKAIFPGGNKDKFKFVSEQDIRRAVRQIAARLIVLQDGNFAAGMALASKYLRNGRKGLAMKGLESDEAFLRKVASLRNDMAKVCDDGKTFTVRLLNSIFRNEMLAKGPVSCKQAYDWTELGFAPADRPVSPSQAEQRALEDVLTGLKDDVKAVLGKDFRLADFAHLGMSFRELKNTLADFSKSFHLSASEGRRYGQMVGTWLKKEIELNLRSDDKGGCGTPAFAADIKRKLMAGVPLCDVGGAMTSNWKKDVTHNLFLPAGGEGKHLCGTVRVGDELIPLWRPAESTSLGELADKGKVKDKDEQDELQGLLSFVTKRNENEPRSLSNIVSSKISDIADGRPLGPKDEPGPKGEKLLKCCMAAGREFLRLYVRRYDLRNVACHREFFLGQNGKLQYRISAVVEGRTLLARFQLDDDGLMTCQRLLNADEQGVGAMTEEEKAELDEVQAWHREFKSEMDEIEEEYSPREEDSRFKKLPFEEKKKNGGLTQKEELACKMVDDKGVGRDTPSIHYSRLRDNPDPPQIPADKLDVNELEINRAQGDFDAWARESVRLAKQKGTGAYTYDGWQYFDFPGKNRSKELGLPYKLYLTMPGSKVKDLHKEDFQRVHTALGGLKAKNDFKVKFLSKISSWPNMTDQVCCYFATQQDLDAAVKALNAAQKHSRHAFFIESGQDVEPKAFRPVCGCDMKGEETTYNSISYTGLLALRVWIAKCLNSGENGFVHEGLKLEFGPVLRLLRKIDNKEDFTKKDRMLFAYVFRFLSVRYGLPVKLKPEANAPALLDAAG